MLTEERRTDKCPLWMSRDSDVALQGLDAHIGNPELLAVRLDALQSTIRQFCCCQSQEGEVRQIAQYGLEPSVLRENCADSLVKKLVRVKGQHRDVLRRSGRGDRIKHGLRQILAEEDSRLLEVEHFGNLFMDGKAAQ